MIVLVTGSSSGIGKATALKFLNEGHFVYGFDKKKPTIDHPNFVPYKVDISDIETYPVLDKKINILINNAGVQNSEDDISVNLKGTIHITENYGINKDIKSIVHIFNAKILTFFEKSLSLQQNRYNIDVKPSEYAQKDYSIYPFCSPICSGEICFHALLS